MKFLLFLLFGTLIFGFAFPAALLLVGFIGIILFGLIIAGLMRGSGVRVYTFGAGGRKKSGSDTTDMFGKDPAGRHEFQNYGEEYEEEGEEGEVIELPASALRKEED